MSVTLAGPPITVGGPVPQAPPYGLLGSVPVSSEPRGLLGADVWGYPTGLGKLWSPCLTGSFADKDLDNEMPLATFGPFGVYYPVTCSALGLDIEEIVARASATIDAVESEAVEREFRNGLAQPDNPFLNDSNVVPLNSGTAMGPIQSLAALEGAIGRTGRRGVIHAPRNVASAWTANGSVQATGDQLFTRLGTLVIAGDGYYTDDPNNEETDLYAPSGEAKTELHTDGWAYATGPVVAYRGGQLVLRSVDQSVNDYVTIIEREYLVAWDTALQVVARVDFSTSP